MRFVISLLALRPGRIGGTESYMRELLAAMPGCLDGDEVVVVAGTQSYVPPGQAPTGPVPIPEAVFLSVAWPGGEVATAKATVRGKAAPGTEITVAGQPAVVKDDGSFATQVALREGANRIEVRAETVDGRTRTSAGRIQVNTKGPPLEADPSNLFDPPDAGGRRPRGSP